MGDPDHGASLARYYDLDLLDDPGDLSLYLALLRRTGGPVLELGAGTGRLAMPLAASGARVTAVDLDRHMLARARRAWRRARTADPDLGGHLSILRGDMRDLALKGRFGLVILALGTFLQLGQRASQQAALAVMARHLRPDGLAIVDAWLPAADDLAMYDGRLLVEWVRDDPETGDRVAKLASARHDAATSTVSLTTFFDAWSARDRGIRRIERSDQLRLVSADELVAMAEAAGMAVEWLSGDHQMGPWGPGAERVVLAGRLV